MLESFFSEIVIDYRLWTIDIAMLIHTSEDDVLVLVISLSWISSLSSPAPGALKLVSVHYTKWGLEFT